jgi:radical SAM protein with 4Fe4S-binding SPASM domain
MGRRPGFQEVLEQLAERQGTPVAAMLQLTARCNFRCSHCYQAERRRDELTTRAWRAVLDDLREAGVLLLTLSGGEPLLRRDFLEIASHARALRFSLQLKTNGFLIDRRMADQLARLAFLDVQMSLYSTRPGVHDGITGLTGSLRRLRSAARMLARRSIRVTMMTPLMSVNADEVDGIVTFCRDGGYEFSMDPSIQVCEDGSCAPAGLRASEEQLEKALANPALVDREALAAAARRRRPQDRVCNAGRLSCFITAAGDVLPCPMLQVALGNVAQKPLIEIWRTSAERARIDAITWGDLETCSTCEHMPWCHRCHGAALVEDGDMLGPSRLACAAARLRRRVAGD